MDSEFAAMVKPYDVSTVLIYPFNWHIKSVQGKESEHNWAARQDAIIRVRGMLKGGAHTRYHDTFMHNLKNDYIKMTLKAVGQIHL